MKKSIPYQITVAWSDEDEAYVAHVPALRYCVGTGATAVKAVKAAEEAAGEILRVMREQGKTPPAVDTTLEKLATLRPIISLRAVATAAQLSVQTLSSKLTRGTAFNADEAARIGRVLAAHGVH